MTILFFVEILSVESFFLQIALEAVEQMNLAT